MPIYRAVVKVDDHEKVRLIDAPNEARAVKHLTGQHITLAAVRSSEQIKEMAALAAKGVQVEVAATE